MPPTFDHPAGDPAAGGARPRITTLLDFKLWSWNSRVFPGIVRLVTHQGDRVRLRIGKLPGQDMEVTVRLPAGGHAGH